MEVVVLHLMGHVMERQLDPAAGYLLQRDLEARGIKVHCKAQTKAILGEDRVEAVALEDGTVYGADIVVMAVGIRPETRIATAAGIHVERGIVVNDQMVTSDPDILALGECVEHEKIVYGLVAPLYDQAKVLAKTLAKADAAFRPVQTATQLKVTGVSVPMPRTARKSCCATPRRASTSASCSSRTRSSAPCFTAKPPMARGSST
jgi:nitrite reductase (NADH) large subunit